MDDRVSNRRLIYAITDYLTEDQIRNSIKNVLIPIGINDEFYVNVVHYQGEPCKYSYIWTSTEKLFDLLIKMGNTGKTTYNKVVKSSSLLKGSKKVEAPLSQYESIDKVKNKFSLLDMTEEDDSVTFPKSENEVEIKEIVLDAIQYSPELVDRIKIVDPKHTKNSCLIEFKQSLFLPIEDATDAAGRIHNMWYADKVPKFVTMKLLLDTLKKFVTNPNKKVEIYHGKTKKLIPYPHINMLETGTGKRLIVTFDPDSHDGQAALYMCRQLLVSDGKQKAKIYFNHFVKKVEKESDSDSDSDSDSSE